MLAVAGWGGLAVTTLAGLVSGIGGALLFAGMFAFFVAIVTLVRGHVQWAHLPSRAAGAVALVGALVAVSVGGALSPSPVSAPTTPQTVLPAAPATSPAADSATNEPATASPTSTPASASSSATDPVSAEIAQARPGTAFALLGTLAVKGRAPMTGYSREAFGPAWSDTDRNGCDQRNDTLRRDLRSVTLKADTNGCAVMTGTLVDPYTGKTVPFSRTSASSPVQIDHVVALADAWVKGAAGWPQAKRTSFANDTLDLTAVSASINASKGSGDAATWLPPATSYRCTYVARQVAVKARYQLAVTAAERAAMARVLTACPATPVPAVSVAKLGGFPVYAPPAPPAPPAPKTTVAPAPQPTVKPAPKPAPQPSPSPSPAAPAPRQGVHPGAFCSPAGALGYTSAGTLMRCSYKAGDTRARWRAA
ncbi:HNH endonuclease family protein [Terrabacter lapilli]